MLGLALVAYEFIMLTVGPTWERCVPLLQILCIGGAFLPLHTLYQNFIISRGRSDVYLRLVALQIVLQIVFTFESCPLWYYSDGCSILCPQCLVYSFLAFCPSQHSSAETRYKHLRILFLFVLIAVVVMVITYYATLWTNVLWVLLLCRIILASLLYLGIMKLPHAKTLEECIDFLLRRNKQ
jgi:hypothetical protein